MRKSKLLLLSAFALGTGVSYSQSSDPLVKIGLKAGGNYSFALETNTTKVGTTTTDHLKDTSQTGRIGYHGGLVAEFPFELGGMGWGAQLEVLYNAIGNKRTYTAAQGTTIAKDDVKLTYFDVLTVPVSFKYYVIEDLSVYIGGYFSFAFKGKTTLEDKSGTAKALNTAGDKEIDLFKSGSEKNEKIDAGVIGGVEYGIPGVEGLFVDARYSFGFLNQIKDDSKADTDQKYTNQVVQLSLGYKFGI